VTPEEIEKLKKNKERMQYLTGGTMDQGAITPVKKLPQAPQGLYERGAQARDTLDTVIEPAVKTAQLATDVFKTGKEAVSQAYRGFTGQPKVPPTPTTTPEPEPEPAPATPAVTPPATQARPTPVQGGLPRDFEGKINSFDISQEGGAQVIRGPEIARPVYQAGLTMAVPSERFNPVFDRRGRQIGQELDSTREDTRQAVMAQNAANSMLPAGGTAGGDSPLELAKFQLDAGDTAFDNQLAIREFQQKQQDKSFEINREFENTIGTDTPIGSFAAAFTSEFGGNPFDVYSQVNALQTAAEENASSGGPMDMFRNPADPRAGALEFLARRLAQTPANSPQYALLQQRYERLAKELGR
jgi:hypothetical protein